MSRAMSVITLAATVVASLQATRMAGEGIVLNAPEPVLIAVWGMALFVLATKARNRLSASRSEAASPR